MKYHSYLFAGIAAAAIVAPAEAAVSSFSTTEAVRNAISKQLNFRYSIDTDGDFKLEFSDCPTIWVRCYNGSERVRADSNRKITRMCIMSFIKTGDKGDFDRFMRSANTFNAGYALKAYAQKEGNTCAFVLEHNEFITENYHTSQFVEGFKTMTSIASALKDGELNIHL